MQIKLTMTPESKERLRRRISASRKGASSPWIATIDPASSTYYYYNRDTHETSWEKPADYTMAADDEVMAAAIKIQACARARGLR